ncbi:MAG: 1-phosphofructokinase family hexose kinase [Fusobacteriaceae bacterium]|jgi:1-phosphofructokinase|nr:1-phosphofructokinase family hexose kinase [Fusobacteriaceae bacterium]
MIGTLTMNPCKDRTLTINGFTYGGMNRVQSVRDDASGKGINVSLVLNALGVPVRTLGLNFTKGGEWLIGSLRAVDLEYRSILVEGRLRENIKLFDVASGVTTELNQKGDFVSPEKQAEFEALLDKELRDLDVLVLTGSVPQGFPDDYYGRIARKAAVSGVKTIVDAEGRLLIEAIKARPYMIKPNLYEFQTAFGLKGARPQDILVLCREIIRNGVEVVCLSMGAQGAMIVDGQGAFYCRPTEIAVKSTQGAGDSLVAGICMAMERGLPLKEMLRLGVICAQGSLILEGTQLCTKEGFARFEKVVTVERIA